MIVRTPGTCGGRARVAGTRYTVATIEMWRLNGATTQEILSIHPLRPEDLRDARQYAAAHRDEIDRDIAEE